MISRSVPGYESVVAMTGLLAQQYQKPDSCLYDLGCSLGASTLSMASRTPSDCKVIAVDNSSAMIAELSSLLEGLPEQARIELIQEDICTLAMQSTSFVAMNFTLQFVPLQSRDALLQKIFDALVPGGALLVSEKVEIEDPDLNQTFIDAHHEFKKAQGYSELEIAQKRQAIENVLIPETISAHKARFERAGFTTSAAWFQCLNFCSLIAQK